MIVKKQVFLIRYIENVLPSYANVDKRPSANGKMRIFAAANQKEDEKGPLGVWTCRRELLTILHFNF